MKTFITTAFTFLLIGAMSSCSNQMEFPRLAEFNIDSVFSSYAYAQKMVYNVYDRPVPLNFDTRGYGMHSDARLNGGAFASGLTDEGQSYIAQTGYMVQKYYRDDVEASWSTACEDIYDVKWKSLRRAYLLMNNIDRVPDATYEQKERIKGECKLMVALIYFEMFKRYGGVPIITREFRPEDDPLTFTQPRATLQQTYDFILSLLEDVIQNYEGMIPANYLLDGNPAEFGRLPMAMAYALKARLMFYAASPLYNSDTPYTNSLGVNSNLICFMNYNKERWNDAAKAATDAINYCLAHGYSLVDFSDKRDDGYNYTIANIEYPTSGNTEVIWGTIQNGAQQGDRWAQYTQIRCKGGVLSQGTAGYAANMSTVNQLERYEIKGAVSGQYKTWEDKLEYAVNIPSGASADQAGKILAEAARKPFENLDPRFYASISYNGVLNYGTLSTPPDMADAYSDDGVNLTQKSGIGSQVAGSIVPLYIRKFTRGYEGREKQMKPISIYMRLAELYLIRAEALNEYNREPSSQVYEDLKLIRQRSGMPEIATTSYEEMKDIIAHERNIELYYEDHRWFDLRRTLQSAKVIPTMIYTLDIRKWYKDANAPWPYKITYEKKVFGERKWNNRWYMNYFPINEVNKGYGLIQNPGW